MWMMPMHLHVNQKSDYDMMMMMMIHGIFKKNEIKSANRSPTSLLLLLLLLLTMFSEAKCI